MDTEIAEAKRNPEDHPRRMCEPTKLCELSATSALTKFYREIEILQQVVCRNITEPVSTMTQGLREPSTQGRL